MLDKSRRSCCLISSPQERKKKKSWGLFSSPDIRRQSLLHTACTGAQFRSLLCSQCPWSSTTTECLHVYSRCFEINPRYCVKVCKMTACSMKHVSSPRVQQNGTWDTWRFKNTLEEFWKYMKGEKSQSWFRSLLTKNEGETLVSDHLTDVIRLPVILKFIHKRNGQYELQMQLHFHMLLHHLTSRSILMIFLRLGEGLRSLCEAKVAYQLNTSWPEYKALCSVVFLIPSLTYKTKMYNARDQPRTLACRALSVKFSFTFYYFLVLW